MRPSSPGKTLRTLPTCHKPRMFGSVMRTKSSERISLSSVVHLFLLVNDGRYSLNQWFQNMLANTWACQYFFLELISQSATASKGTFKFGPWISMLLGVKASRSLGSVLTGAIGLEFKIPSTSTNAVCRTSALTRLPCNIAYKARLQDFTSRFTTPFMWGELGALKIHSVRLTDSFCAILPWDSRSQPSFSSLAAPTKFVPLSLVMLLG